MAKAVKKKETRRRTSKDDALPLGRENFMIIGAGVAVVILGYLAMLSGGVEGFLSLVLAPTLLVLGYCVIIPFGILFKKSYIKSATPDTPSKQ